MQSINSSTAASRELYTKLFMNIQITKMIKKVSTLLMLVTCLIVVLVSCKKSSTSNPVNPTGNVSGKLKRITQSDPINRLAYITSLEYDGNNRLIKFNEWTEDSSFTPVKITDANYSLLAYGGTNDFPVKNIITEKSGIIDSTLYYYDLQNRVIKEDYYYGNAISVRNTYSYLSSTVVMLNKYNKSGSTLQLQHVDSLIYDAQSKIMETRFHNPANVYTGNGTYLYDNKSNPLSTVNAFKYIYTLYGDDLKYFYKAPNNLVTFNKVIPPSNSTISYVLNYSSNSFPIDGSATISGSSVPSQTFKLKYEYY